MEENSDNSSSNWLDKYDAFIFKAVRLAGAIGVLTCSLRASYDYMQGDIVDAFVDVAVGVGVVALVIMETRDRDGLG